MTPSQSTGYTPCFLVYRAEAVLPSDVEHDSPQVTNYVEEATESAHHDDVDTLEEAKEITLERSAIYQKRLRRYHSCQV